MRTTHGNLKEIHKGMLRTPGRCSTSAILIIHECSRRISVTSVGVDAE